MAVSPGGAGTEMRGQPPTRRANWSQKGRVSRKHRGDACLAHGRVRTHLPHSGSGRDPRTQPVSCRSGLLTYRGPIGFFYRESSN